MPIRRRNPRKKVILAGVQGLVIGIVGVLLFGLILNLSNDKKDEKEEVAATPTEQTEKEKEDDKTVEVSAEATLPFKAKQYGLFSSKESAVAFMSEQPSLQKAGIVGVDGQFYIWSELYVNDVSSSQVDTIPTFIKPLFVSTKGCEDPKVQNMINILQEEKISKTFFDAIVNKENYPDDLATIVNAVTAFSDSTAALRLHLFTHYVEQNPCVKLSF